MTCIQFPLHFRTNKPRLHGLSRHLGLLVLGLVLVAGCSQQTPSVVATVTLPPLPPGATSNQAAPIMQITGNCARDELLSYLRTTSSLAKDFSDTVKKSTNFSPQQIAPALQRLTDLNGALLALKVPACATNHAVTLKAMFSVALAAYKQFSTGTGLTVDLAKAASNMSVQYSLVTAEEAQLVDYYNKLPLK